MTLVPLLAGLATVGTGLALVWAASRRRTVRVAVQTVAARRGPVSVRLRYTFVDGKRPEEGDLRGLLGRITQAAGAEKQAQLAGLLAEAREDWGVEIVGIDLDPA